MTPLGRFIVLEGGEGAGKSTQAKRLVSALQERGLRVHLTREVGGAPLAEEIRQFWLAERQESWDALTELLLIFAARREHLVKTIWPRLQTGEWVVSDRFVGSSLAYQGDVMGVGQDKINVLYALIAGDFTPDLTLLLDVPVARARTRITHRQFDRYERQPALFHETLRAAYLRLAQSPAWQTINAAVDQDSVATAIWQAVMPLLPVPR